ncbi:MAG: MmgE/PrpD family protein [Thermomicrobiales bacterium]
MTEKLPVSRLLAEALASTRYADLPDEIVDHARRAVLDWAGSALAGAFEPAAAMARAFVADLGTSSQATIFPDRRGSAPAAALANGVASHILEYDDVHKGSTLHAAAPVIPAALAVAEREHASGEAFLLAVVLGYEAALRVGEAVNPSHYRYFHPTGTAATFGAAVAAGSLIGLDPPRMLDALGSAGTTAAGLWEFNADGAMSKHLHPGKAAFNGILAADLAAQGFTGASRILEGERGFFAAMSDGADPTRITDGLGHHWKIAENCYKLHSCCGHTHTAIDAALDLRPALGPDPVNAVRSIHIDHYGPGYEIVKEMNPRTPYQAKFSLAYVVAAALSEGAAGLPQFSEERFSPDGTIDHDLARLLAQTTIKVNDDLTAMYPGAWPARLVIETTGGQTLRAGGDYPRGNPEAPASTETLAAKARSLIAPHYGAGQADRIIAQIAQLDRLRDMTLFDWTGPAK